MFEHILVPVDGSALAECALPHAVALARAFEGRITLLRVLERDRLAGLAQFVDPLGWEIGRAEAQAYLDALTARLQRVGLEVRNALLEGEAAERIVEYAHSDDAGLIVLSSHGQSGFTGWNISSVVQKIIRRLYLPTMIVRAYQPVAGGLGDLRYRRLLVPLDGSQRAEYVLPLAITLARRDRSQLLLAHVVSGPPMPRRARPAPEDLELAKRVVERNREEAARYLEQLLTWLSGEEIDVQTRLLVSDSPMERLHDLAEDEQADLVLFSAHGSSGRTRWPYGSVALNYIVYGTAPVLIVQDLSPEEFAPTRAELMAKEYKGN